MKGIAIIIVLLLLSLPLSAQESFASTSAADSDQDGLSDALENKLLVQFQPRLLINRDDCSVRPAEFVPLERSPTVRAEDGTIYGQVFPRDGKADEIELHYYHLWPKDCGERGHKLDAEHVSVLLKRSKESSATTWKAKYWYAAAHEDTVCDASQISRAATLSAEESGAQVWISAGKHASFLNKVLCTRGCGGDHCRAMEPLRIAKLINLGELSKPMNGAVWTGSVAWPLSDKLRRSDFPESRTEALQRLPVTDIAWAHPDNRPMQGAILGGNSTLLATVTGARGANTALVVANGRTDAALDQATHRTANSLTRSYNKVVGTFQKTVIKTGEALAVESEQ